MLRALAFLLAFCAGTPLGAQERLNVCLYYDGPENAAGFVVGERSAVMVRNLLGHFNEADVFMAPVAAYAKDDLAFCDRALYMGTYFDARMPDAFLSDAVRFRKPVLWMNYNIWKLQEAFGKSAFRAAWGFDYQRIEGKETPPGVIPAFYRTFTYKGAQFTKPAFLDARGRFIGHPEIVVVQNEGAQVLSEAVHSATGARIPYALRKGNFFYIADNPVSVIDERDRYLILADLLFDFLQLEPRTDKRYAAVRIEDVHPGYDLQLLRATIEVFRKRKVPFAISLIPRYVGPDRPGGLELTQDARFLELIRHAVRSGASILAHGYEHQLTIDLGCGVSYTGEGYEFWDVCKNAPLPFDSVEFVQQRVYRAKTILRQVRLPYAGWVTPHYAASPLAIRVIHASFGLVLQRMRYFVDGHPMTPANAIDQFFPYTIVRDYWGLHVWPENLGYVPLPSQGGKPTHVEDMLELARLNKVVRDAWASFFWHPPLIRTEFGLKSLERLIDGVRAEGYEFVSLQELRARGE